VTLEVSSSLTSGVDGSQFRLKLKKLKLENEIPSPVATQSYRYPNVEKIKKSRFRFRSLPDIDGLREFGKIKLFWSKDKVDSHLIPIIKNIKNQSQTDKSKISFYFKK